MAVVLTYGAGVPAVKVGRIAGQFAKPRSSPTERVGELELPSFRGHMVNDDAPDAAARVPDPRRLGGRVPPGGVHAEPRARLHQGRLRRPLPGAPVEPAVRRVERGGAPLRGASPAEIDSALRFMAACGIDLEAEQSLHQVDFYTSHDALILGYEEALTRMDSITGDWYDCSAHMLWVGERTRQLDGAHIDFLAGIHNPDRMQDQRVDHARRGGGAVRPVEPRPHSGPPHAHHPDGRRRHRRRAAPAARGRARGRASGGVGV